MAKGTWRGRDLWDHLRRSAARLRFVLTRQHVADETADELRWHLEMLTERYIAGGMASDEARLAATRQLGNVTRVREDVHDMNGLGWVETVAQDVVHACRLFARTPSLALVVVVTLALGIGANSALVRLAYAALACRATSSPCWACPSRSVEISRTTTSGLETIGS